MKNTKTNYKHIDFPIDTYAKIVSEMVDFNFFYGETGTIIKNNGGYLGVTLKFDKPRHFKNGSVQESFNFNPENLEPISVPKKKVRKFYSLADIINNAKDGEIFEATYAIDQHWHITKLVGFIRYCSKTGEEVYDDIVKLTPSNMRADYELI